MKTTMTEKAAKFWNRNKKWILGTGAFVLTAFGVYCLVTGGKETKNDGTETETDIQETPEKSELELEPEAKMNDPANQLTGGGWVLEDELELELEAKKNAPANQLTGGGWVLEDELGEPDFPQLIANDVPLSSLGQFGLDMIERAKAKGLEGCDWGDARVNKVEEAHAGIIIILYGADEETKPEENQEGAA